jgi:hypothetical protein
MANKDLGKGIDKLEEKVDNLKNKKFDVFGFSMTPTTIGAAFAILSTVLGGYMLHSKSTTTIML